MGYRIIVKSRAGYADTEQEMGDTGEVFDTLDEALRAKADIEEGDEMREWFQAACELHSIECWFEVVQEE